MTEIAFTVNEIDHTLKHLHRWTTPAKVKVPITFKPGKAHLHPDPLGTVCIIAPWNYPVQLLFAPLVPALAAGNTAVLKPSEVTPTVSALIEELVRIYFDRHVVAVVTGAVDETTALLEQRFDHIFYTGNGKVGRVVMRAAAEAPDAGDAGARRQESGDRRRGRQRRRCGTPHRLGEISQRGQTCVAPDYVLVHDGIEDELLAALAKASARSTVPIPGGPRLRPDRQPSPFRPPVEPDPGRRLRRHRGRRERRSRRVGISRRPCSPA